ncbi:YciI family protein [Roseivirga sp.]|uniref:YciI family protein n=1 Tax=Roseivirga sp. TaxID=1964215 RepID=UPI003B8B2568
MKKLFITTFLLFSFGVFAQDQGRYTFVFLNTNENRADLPKNEVDSLQAGHMANIGRLVKARKMIAAGPFDGGGGVFLFDTNVQETKAILDSDPAIAAGRFNLEVMAFDMAMGEICTLWDKPEEDIGMTIYYLARYTNKGNGFGTKTSNHTVRHMRDAQRMFKGLEVLSVLKFDGNAGQVVIFKAPESDAYEAYFAKQKLVRKGAMEVYVKPLYFPVGVFCEK